MQNDEPCEKEEIAVYQFIHYVNKALRWSIRDYDREWDRRHDLEFLPEDGDICDLVSTKLWLTYDEEQGIYFFWRSDGLGEPMKIRCEELAFAMDDLTVDQQDAIIKVYQEEMSMAEYAAEQGISRSTAYRRLKVTLETLAEGMRRRMEEDDYENWKSAGKIPSGTERPIDPHCERHSGRTKRRR